MGRRHTDTAASTVTVIGHGQTWVGSRANVHGYPVQLRGSRGTALACDVATAEALRDALVDLLGPAVPVFLAGPPVTASPPPRDLVPTPIGRTRLDEWGNIIDPEESTDV